MNATPGTAGPAAAALALSREPQRGVYLREALRTLREVGTQEAIDRVVLGSTFLLAKPEAVAGRRLPRIADFVLEHGFEIVGVEPVQMDRLRTRTLWADHLDQGPLAVGRLLDLAGAGAPGVLLLIRAHADESTATASEQVGRLKGRAVAQPGDGSLRGRLGVSTPSLNFVHTPDDQAGVLAELALLLTPERLSVALRALLAGPALDDDELAPAFRQLEAETPADELNLACAVRRLAEADPVLARTAKPALDPGTELTPQDRDAIIDRVAAEEALSVWERLTLVAHLIGDSRKTFGMVSPKSSPSAAGPAAASMALTSLNPVEVGA